MLRVLHTTIGFQPGGRREAIRTLAQNLQPLDVASELCCLGELGAPPEALAGLFEDPLVLHRSGRARGGDAKKLLDFCRARGIDLIHAHDAASQWLAALARTRRPRLKIIMTFHRSLPFESARPRDRLRNAIAGFLCQAIVVGSRERQRHFVAENHVSARKVVRIPFGVDLERFHPDAAARRDVRKVIGASDETFVCGAAGHFGPEKGIDVAIRAFGAFLERAGQRPAMLVVLGDGSPEQRDFVHREAAGIAPGRVVFAGRQPDIERWFAAMDALIHAPRQEAFGLVLAEALATGLPIVATDVGGIPDIVRPDENGFLAASGDIPQLAADLCRLHQNDALRQQLAHNALTIGTSEYSAERYARDHLRLYEDIVAGRGAASSSATSGLADRQAQFARAGVK